MILCQTKYYRKLDYEVERNFAKMNIQVNKIFEIKIKNKIISPLYFVFENDVFIKYISNVIGIDFSFLHLSVEIWSSNVWISEGITWYNLFLLQYTPTRAWSVKTVASMVSTENQSRQMK